MCIQWVNTQWEHASPIFFPNKLDKGKIIPSLELALQSLLLTKTALPSLYSVFTLDYTQKLGMSR